MCLRPLYLALSLSSACCTTTTNLPNPKHLENSIHCPTDSHLVTVEGKKADSNKHFETACLVKDFDTPEELCEKTRGKLIVIHAQPGAPFFYCE